MSIAKKNPISWTVLVVAIMAAMVSGLAYAAAEALAPSPESENEQAGSHGDRAEDGPPRFMPPHPALLERARRGEVTLPEFVTDPDVRRQLGIEQPQGFAAGPQGSWRALALLVEFTDNPSQVGAGYFDTLLFGSGNGTLKDYYSAVSYGSLDIVTVNLPSAIDWGTMPRTYAYYVDGNNGFGSYPRNAQKLAEDAVLAADPIVDYSQYDNNNDGWVDTVFIIHAGPGAELTGSANHIWSHSWATVTDPMVDGVRVNSYTAEPEYWANPPDMTVGVFAHELGHVFGLPDLYDTDGSSAGVGHWSLMAGGAWNGTLGDTPALPDPWSRAALDFVTPVKVTADMTGVSFPAAASSQTVYRLWTNGAAGSEYFLVENRQKIGYDAGLPAAGLLIWHVDEGKGGNQAECDQLNNWLCGASHQKVALEQADGHWDLEHMTDLGDGGDPYPGTTNKRQFGASTTPNSSAYGHSSDTCVEVSAISNSGLTMTADLSVSCVDAFEPDDSWGTAGEIADGIPQAHNIYPVGDEDWLKFTLGVESEVTIESSGPAGDTRLWLYDSALSELEFNDDGGPGSWSRIDRLCGQDALPAGLYYLKVDEFGDDEVIPAYDISFDVVKTCPVPPTTLWIEPSSADLTVGDAITVSVMISDVTDLSAVELEIAFDPAKLEVVDSDVNSGGTQISPGDCPLPDTIAQNGANNISGTIAYEVSSAAPSPSCNGGVVARATFRALAAGVSPLHFAGSLLTNAFSQTIPANTQDGVLNIQPGSGSLEGNVLLQGRSNHGGAEVCVRDGETPVACTTSDISGYYTLTATAGAYTVTVEMERYLDGERAAVTLSNATTTTLPALSLKGGDANDDDAIDILDLSLMSTLQGLSCGQTGWDGRADVNADCSVNIQDLAIAGGNFQESSPVNWSLSAPGEISASSSSANGAAIWLQGPSEQLLAGEEITVTVHISDAADLYAAQFGLTFAPGDVQVVDSDPETGGVQIREGSCPAPDFVVANAADVSNGTIEYALTQLNPRVPVNGNCTVAAIRLRLLKTGLTTIQLNDGILSDPNGRSLPFDSTDLALAVKAEYFTFLPLLSKGGGD